MLKIILYIYTYVINTYVKTSVMATRIIKSNNLIFVTEYYYFISSLVSYRLVVS